VRVANSDGFQPTRLCELHHPAQCLFDNSRVVLMEKGTKIRHRVASIAANTGCSSVDARSRRAVSPLEGSPATDALGAAARTGGSIFSGSGSAPLCCSVWLKMRRQWARSDRKARIPRVHPMRLQRSYSKTEIKPCAQNQERMSVLPSPRISTFGLGLK
jgi:hypothetical protein